MSHLDRRSFLELAALGAAGLALGARPARAGVSDARYLFVIGGLGGASILDSFLPVPTSTSPRGAERTTIPDAQVASIAGSELRCVLPFGAAVGSYRFGNGYSQQDFLSRHKDDLVVMTCEASTVNHASGQVRAITGDGVDQGRTILEAAAARWGAGLVLPAVTMAGAGFAVDGTDPTLAPEERAIAVGDPRFFALTTHGARGVRGAPSAERLARARAVRDRLEQASAFGRTYAHTETLRRYARLRAQARGLEEADLVSQLTIARELPLADFGIAPSPYAERLAAAFPRLASDDFEAQAALAFLLARYGVSCATAISPSGAIESEMIEGERVITNTQLAFDYSHTDHRAAQSAMWSRVLRVLDALVTLLKEEHVGGDPSAPTMWERSVVYVATEFGREKVRPRDATAFPTGHHQNNGVLLLSPLLRGNRVYGGVDPESCLTYGFDPETGEPAPGTAMTMRDVYAAIAGALDIRYEGRRELPAMVRGA